MRRADDLDPIVRARAARAPVPQPGALPDPLAVAPAATAPNRPGGPRTGARAGLRRGAWAWPFALALLFAAGIAAWSQWRMLAELEEERRTLLADALTLESRLSDVLLAEQRNLRQLADALPAQVNDEQLVRQPQVLQGLRRLWISVLVLDSGNRVLAQAPADAARPEVLPGPTLSSGIDDGGISAHLVRATPSGGRVIVRFAPATLLRQTVPWWLAQRYDVRMVDGLGQRLAGPVQTLPSRWRQTHQVSLEPAFNDTYLELTAHEAHRPWWSTVLPLLMALFVGLSALAALVLRRRLRQLAAAESRWRTEAAWRGAIEDSLTVGLRGRDMDGRIVHVNRAFCDMVGRSPDELLGATPPFPYWAPDQMEVSMQRNQRTLAGHAPREGYEARWMTRDGRPLLVMIFEAPLVDAQGRQTGWMGSIIDITARREAEEREARHAQLLATQARLSMLGEVASALAHQLNQPLAAISGYAGGVARSLQRARFDQPEVIEAVRRLGEQAGEAGRIVQRIRAFVTRRAPQRERCEVAGIVSRATALLHRDLAAGHVELRSDLADGLPAVMVDPVLIEQVLINLVRNALDALSARPGAASRGMAPPAGGRIRIRARTAGQRFVRVDVDDDGPGLQGVDIQSLSAPFFSTKSDGMGMGLAISRSVIEAHYGALEAGASELGGARLSFTLPVADAVPVAPPPSAGEAAPTPASGSQVDAQPQPEAEVPR